ncbi:hypothetical protein D3C87_2038130 [compost metagenome]
MALVLSIKSATRASVAGFLPMTRMELSPRPTARSNRPPLCLLSEPKIDAATDQSRTSGLVTSGPKRSFVVCSMHMAIAA